MINNNRQTGKQWAENYNKFQPTHADDKNLRPYCLSIDWLQLYCHRTAGFKPDEINDWGFTLAAVDHGTKVWKQIHELISPEGQKIGEVCWEPHSSKFSPLAANFKVENSILYEPNGLDKVFEALTFAGLEYKGITRIDVCYDCNEFYAGLSPQNLITRFMDQDYWKVGQYEYFPFLSAKNKFEQVKGGALQSRGGKLVQYRGKTYKILPHECNSITWGKRSSDIQVQLYNKSKELKEVKMKDYIMKTWELNGLDIKKDVWRLEIRLSNSGKDFISVEDNAPFRLHVQDIILQEQLEMLFTSLAYKHFRWYKFDGHLKLQNNRPLRVLCLCNRPCYRPKRRVTRPDKTKGLATAVNQITKLICQEATKAAINDKVRNSPAYIPSDPLPYKECEGTLYILKRAKDILQATYGAEKTAKENKIKNAYITGDVDLMHEIADWRDYYEDHPASPVKAPWYQTARAAKHMYLQQLAAQRHAQKMAEERAEMGLVDWNSLSISLEALFNPKLYKQDEQSYSKWLHWNRPDGCPF